MTAVAVAFIAAVTPGTAHGDPTPGSAGTDVTLPATDSQVTVAGRGEFAGMQFTINQTKNLTNQAISVHWTGGQPTRQGVGRYDADYVQIFQCWGDDDGTNPDNPGPPPEQCEQGGSIRPSGNKGSVPGGFAETRLISRTDWPNYDQVKSYGAVEPDSVNVWMPFKAVDGTVVGAPLNSHYSPFIPGSVFWLNPYFDVNTTNEVPAVATAQSGEGGARFQVVTGVESSGLGCGQKLILTPGGQPTVPKCWLVIVPRGTPLEENAGTPWGVDQTTADQTGVISSPLSPTAWPNRIAVPLEFNPVDSPCALGAKERRIVGNELALDAIASWQPALCSSGGPPYSYATLSDTTARLQITNPVPGSPGMVVVGAPLSGEDDPSNPTVYAPLTLSGIGIGFNWERSPRLEAPPGEQDLNGAPIADVNLTPRLVAKLLTQSYQYALPNLNGVPPGDAYSWLTNNPPSLGDDPDFLQWNPEFAYLQPGARRNVAALSLPDGTSDLAQEVWQWVLADPEAKAWLDGNADQWGMKVNPVYSTNAALNPSGAAFGDPVPNDFPKAEPYCYDPHTFALPLCGTDWVPYVGSLADAARFTANANDSAKIDINPSPTGPIDAWQAVLPQPAGFRSFVSLTDTASATRYGVQMAKLSAAGDDGAGRSFVAPDQSGLTAGVATMSPSSDPTFLVPDATKRAADAYPLTTVTYAAIRPLALDSTARSEYAALLDYAAGAGQHLGIRLGDLPLGYAPLTGALNAQLVAAARSVRDLQPPPTPPDGTPAVSDSSGARASGGAASSASTRGAGGIASPSPSVPSPPPASTKTEIAASPPSTQATPITAIGNARFAFITLFGVAVASGLLALEITKRPRRLPPATLPTSEPASR